MLSKSKITYLNQKTEREEIQKNKISSHLEIQSNIDLNTAVDSDFNEKWMQETFEDYWKQSAQWATKWTNLMLHPTKSFVSLLKTASLQPNIANWLADGFNTPEKILAEIEYKK
jgi:hypothetical protein